MDRGAVDGGAGATLTLAAIVGQALAGTTVTNAASVTAADQPDYDTTNNSASAAVTVQSADLALSMSVDRPTPNVGDTVTFAVNLANEGPHTATGIAVTDLLPPGLSYASHSASQGGYVGGTGLWTVGTLSSGAGAVLTLSAVIGSGVGGAITNTATITAAGPFDP